MAHIHTKMSVPKVMLPPLAAICCCSDATRTPHHIIAMLAQIDDKSNQRNNAHL